MTQDAFENQKKLVDKNGEPIEVGETVRYYAAKPNLAGRQGWARICDWNGEELQVKVWVEAWAGYGTDAMPWPVQWDEVKQAYVAMQTKADGEESWLEVEPEAYSFDQPAEKWPDCLSVIAMEFMQENDVAFCLQGNGLSMVEVVDPNGLLGSILFNGELRLKKIFGAEEVLPIVYYAHPKALAFMSFAFDENDNNPRNTLYHHAHLLLDTLTLLVDEAKLNPENQIDGKIQLDKIVGDWLIAAEKLKIKVLPYRPKPESFSVGGAGGGPIKKPNVQVQPNSGKNK